jgi:hypothetical protein
MSSSRRRALAALDDDCVLQLTQRCFGRGKIDYNNFVVGEIQYLSASTLVVSPGIEVKYGLTHQVASKRTSRTSIGISPLQFLAVLAQGPLPPALVYAFDFNRRHGHSW